VYTSYQNPWSYHNPQQNDKTRASRKGSAARGVGNDLSASVFADTPTQHSQTYAKSFYQIPLFIDKQNNQIEGYNTHAKNTLTIPSKSERFLFNLESTMLSTTV
jgi:hypothetical protein